LPTVGRGVTADPEFRFWMLPERRHSSIHPFYLRGFPGDTGIRVRFTLVRIR
jgi:hypothetical protein